MRTDNDLEAILVALSESGCRFLVVGGVAVVMHGHMRFTRDLDLFIDLEQTNLLLAISALKALGYGPRAPVPLDAFADAQQRRTWIEEKGMVVFSLWSATRPATEVDIFAEPPFDFDELWGRAVVASIGGHDIPVVALSDLRRLKALAGRPQDLTDIEALSRLHGEPDGS